MKSRTRYDSTKIIIFLTIFVAILALICVMAYKFIEPFGAEVSGTLAITIFLSLSMLVGIALMAIGLASPNIFKAETKKEDYPVEFIKIYDELTEKDFINIEDTRKNANKLNKLRTVNVMAIVISFLLLLFSDSEYPIAVYFWIGTVMAVSTVTLLIATKSTSQSIMEYKHIFKREIIPEFIKKVNPNLEFDIYDDFKKGVYNDLYVESNFNTYATYNNFKSDDYIEGKIDDGAVVRLTDMVNTYYVDDGRVTEFEGLFGVLFTTVIDPKIDIRMRLFMGHKEYDMPRVTTGYDKIDSMYSIYTEDKDLVVNLTKSGLFDEFNRLLVTTSCYPEIIVKKGKIYVRCYASGMFEPKLSDNSKMLEPLYYYYENFKGMLDSFEMVRKHFGNLK